MGVYYTKRFCEEIDQNIQTKISMPAVLFSKRSLNVTVININSFENLLQEKIHDVFIIKPNGLIYYSSDSKRDNIHYERYLEKEEIEQFKKINEDFPENQIIYCTRDGKSFISILSPLSNRGHLMGTLYIKIEADAIAARKKAVISIFFIGSLLTIAVTSLFEALLLHRLFVPRINTTRAVLSSVEQGDLAARIPGAASLDQLGSLMRHANRMIASTERNTHLLELLNEASSSFVTADSLEKLSELADKAVADLHTCIQKTPCIGTSLQIRKEREQTRYSRSLQLTMDFDTGFQLPQVHLQDIEMTGRSNDKKYLFTLLSMANSAFFRLHSWNKTQAAEKKYRTLFSSAVEGIFSCAVDGYLEVANPALAAMMGYGSQKSMLEQFNQNNKALLGDTEEQSLLFERINDHDQLEDEEIRLRRADGCRFWASLTAHAKRDSKGHLIAMEGRIVNIEERKRREKAEYEYLTAEAANQAKSEMLGVLKKKNQQLEQTLAELHETQLRMMQAERMAAIGMTASGVAHDLNNILAGVISYSELMLYHLPDDSGLRKAAQGILTSGKRAADVVADLLTLTRGTTHNKTPVLLNTIITEYLDSAEFKYLSEQHPDIQVNTDLAQNLFPVLSAPAYLHKMIMNLVTNSIEALEAAESGGEVLLVTENTAPASDSDVSAPPPPSMEADNYVTIKIIDNGPGIDKADLEHIFEPFYTKKIMGRSGTGLGLTIVQNAVIEHKGKIEVSSNEQGTSFTIQLPANTKSEVTTLTSTSDEERDVLLSGSGTILVVDDDATIRDTVESMLQEFGYTVHLAQSGEEAVEFCKMHKVDLVLLDMLMPPGMNGRQAFEAIREIHPQQKALIVSGFSEGSEVTRAMKAGCCGLLKKPYTMTQLARLLNKVTSQKAQAIL
jgi:PAS domain S-box-containing protein